MHGRHLTKRGDAYVFQLRLPRELDPHFISAPVRLHLGRIPKRQAQRTARLLAAAASIAFQRILAMPPEQRTDPQQLVLEALQRDIGLSTPLFVGLAEIDKSEPSDPQLRAKMVEMGLNGLSDLVADRARGSSAIAAGSGPHVEKYFTALISDEHLARKALDMPLAEPQQGDPALGIVLAQLQVLGAGQEALRASLAVKTSASQAPLFSIAARDYIALLTKAHGEGYDELKYLRHRAAVFLALMPDKPCDQYTGADLQDFLEEVRFMAPNASKRPGYDLSRVKEMIEKGKASGAPGLSRSTLINNYLGRIKTIIRRGCEAAKVSAGIEGARLVVPREVPKPVVKLTLDYGGLDKLFRAGIATGLMADAMLPLLGFLSGRRLGLLTFMHGRNFQQRHGVWIVQPQNRVERNGEWIRVPTKTDESLGAYVIHDFLSQIGFVDWARRRDEYVFASLLDAKDPADSASKRMQRLYDSVGIDRKVWSAFHGLRHAKIDEDRTSKVAERTTRKQVGHELGDVHGNYGKRDMLRTELIELSTVPLPPAIDWDMFKALDFDKLADAKPRRGRPRKR
jgi:integrase